MREIEMRRWFADEMTQWHFAALRAAWADPNHIAPRPSTDAVETLYDELLQAGFFYKTQRSDFVLTQPGERICASHWKS